MRRIIIICTLLLISLNLLSTNMQLNKITQNVYQLDFVVPAYETKTAVINNEFTQKLTVTGTEKESWSENLNGLPQSEQWLFVPGGFRAEISLLNPVVDHRQNFTCDTDDTIPTGNDWIDISQPMSFRGNNLVSFVIKPFKYDKYNKDLSVLTSAQIDIRFVVDYRQTTRNTENLYTPSTCQMLKALCLNRDEIRETTRTPGSYIILYNGTTNETIIQALADWKRQKGFDVRMVNTSTLGNTTTGIKNYLQNAYNTWVNPPEFIFILGKPTGTNGVPTYIDYFNYNTAGDYKYTQLDGDDLVPDAYVGRATFTNSTELQTIINKIMNYEKYQSLATNDWSNRALLVGDPNNSGASCITTVNYIKDLITHYNPDAVFSEVTSGYFPPSINQALNTGVGAYWYRGHGDFSGYSSTDINNLNNTGKYPFLSYITCFTATFSNPQASMAELFLKAGTASVPKGAIAVVGASCETHTCLNNILTGGIAHSLYVDKLSKAGPAMVRGKLAFLANFPQNPSNYLNEYSQAINLMGDPALDVWLKPPTLINVAYPQLMYQEGGVAQIRVTDTEGIPVADAWVTLWKSASELLVTGYTNEAGLIVLEYNALTAGNVKLTVTKPDFKTFQANITVSANPALVTLNPIPALAQCYAGSSVSFPITITNYNTNLNNVTGTLTTLDEFVSITQSDASFGNISAGASATSSQNYIITFSQDMEKGKPIYLSLMLNFSEGNFELPIVCTENGANLVITTAAFGNNLLNHGNNTLNVTLHNESAAMVSGLTATLESTHPLVSVSNPQQTIGTVNGNASVNLPAVFTLNVAENLPEGVIVTFYLELSNTSGFQQRLTISKAVGTPSTNDITGPDSYGYICYGPGDEGYQVYDWIEIDPALGGAGTNLNFSDTDIEGSGDYSTVTIPFQFRYYGIVYSQITICSNGYILPGNVGSVEWMNWQIPGAMCPKPIIAPFWDDLLTDTSGRVLYRYDATRHAFIVQWQNMPNRYSESQRETFQAVLYDPFYVSSPTGDSPILFQYKLFNNVDQGNYGGDYVDHGQFASIGIGDHTGLNGVEYTFNNSYPGTAQTLANFTTLYFTTLPNYITIPNPIILNNQINEVTGNGNGMIDAGELIDLSLIIKNTGMGTLNETTATLSTQDTYVIVIQDEAILPALFTNQMASTSPMFRIQIAQNCPNLHSAVFELNLENQLFTFPLTFNLSVHAISISMTNLHYSDSNDGYPAPGESVTMSFDLTNESLLNALNVSVQLTSPDGIIANPLNQTISLLPDASQTVNYTLDLNSTLAQGEQLIFGLTLSISGIYTQNYQLPCLVGAPDILFSSGFEEEIPLSKWIQYLNVVVDPAQYINPTGNEAVLYFSAGNPNSYVLSNFISANDILGGEIKFKYYTMNPEAGFSVQASYNSGQTFQSVWSASGQTETPREVTIPIENIPPGTIMITYLFLATRTGAAIDAFILDDVEIKAVHHTPGMISGNVSLDLFPENVTQAAVQLLFSDIVVHPDVQGFYQFPAFAGDNYVTVSLDGYRPVSQYSVVPVTSGETSSGQNLALQRLRAPLNLSSSLVGNQLTLNWDIEGGNARKTSDLADNINCKNDRYLSPNYYKIWLKRNNFTQQDTSSTQTYTRTMVLQGEYHIYVQSVYIFEDGLETYSPASDTLIVVYTDNSDNISKPVFALQQNSPNPFNPTTTINFSIPEKRNVSLIIYNIKGQTVKTLLNCEIKEGNHSIIWNGCDNHNNQVGSGIYYYRLKTGKNEITRKMILMK